MKLIIIAIGLCLLSAGITYGEDMRVPVEYIRASSSLPDNPAEQNEALLRRIRYCSDKAFDNRADTAWAEGAPGAGLNETITIKIVRPITLDELEVMPGFFDARYFKANNRIKRFRLESGDGRWKEEFACSDNREAQRRKLTKTVQATEIVFTVLEVFKGEKWDDTCLSELAFFNKGARYELLCNRIQYAGGAYSLSVQTEAAGIFPRGEGGYPIALFTLKQDGTLGGDLGPGSQVGIPILEGAWKFKSDCTLELTYTYGVQRKMMGEDEAESEGLSRYSTEGTGGMVLSLLGEKPKKRGESFDDSSEFLCVLLTRTDG
jgi:hypothetical protein